MDERLLYRIAYMYYVLDMSLDEISDELRATYRESRVPRPPNGRRPPQFAKGTLSKNLKKAREKGIVRFVFEAPRLARWETQLIQQFNLKDAIVVATPPAPLHEPIHRQQLGKAAADYVMERLSNGGRLGLCGGRTMSYFAHSLRSDRITELDVYTLAASSLEPIEYAASTVVGTAVLSLKEGKGPAVKIRGHGALLPLLGLDTSFEVYRKVRADIIEEARKWCDILVAGVGGLTVESSCVLRAPGLDVESKVARLRQLGAVGDFLYQLFDDEGVPVKCDLNDQVVGLGLAELPAMTREGRLIVAVAGGADKVPAIRALLRSQRVTTLVTDEETARGLAKIER